METEETVTQLLHAAGSGDEQAFQRLYERTYAELRSRAHQIRRDRADATLNTTALVHEAYLKLVPGDGLLATDRVHFFRIAARAMRQVLVDAARRRSTRRRGFERVAAEQAVPDPRNDALSADVLMLDTALRELEAISPRQASVVECRFFAGLSVEDTATALSISTPTVKRDWRIARAWLAQAMAGPGSAERG
jgi:RNA polymerase sigma factor (TIGR02999 family)